MYDWNALQSIMTSAGKIPLSIELTFGLQSISKYPEIDRNDMVVKLNRLLGFATEAPELWSVLLRDDNCLFKDIISLANTPDNRFDLWYRVVQCASGLSYVGLSNDALFRIYVAYKLCSDESDVMFDTYVFFGPEAFKQRLYNAFEKFSYRKYLDESNPLMRVRMSIPGMIRDNTVHETVSFDDKMVGAVQKALTLGSAFPNTDASDHVQFFYEHNDIKYLDYSMKIKPVNEHATQLMLTSPKGDRELFLVTSNHHQASLQRVAPNIAWCIAYAPAAFKDKPIKEVLDYMKPLYINKFGDKK